MDSHTLIQATHPNHAFRVGLHTTRLQVTPVSAELQAVQQTGERHIAFPAVIPLLECQDGA